MSKTLNIELNVRRMEAQSILTTSAIAVDSTPVDNVPAGAAVRGGGATGNGNAVPVRAGF